MRRGVRAAVDVREVPGPGAVREGAKADRGLTLPLPVRAGEPERRAAVHVPDAPAVEADVDAVVSSPLKSSNWHGAT